MLCNGYMNVGIKILYFFTDLILPLVVGYVIKERGKIRQEFFDKMIVFSIVVLAPVLTILSFWTIDMDRGLIWLPILGILMQVIPGVLGFIVAKIKYKNPLEQGSYILSATLINRGVVGTLSVFILFGEAGYAYAQLMMLLSNVYLYMFCFPLSEYFYQLHEGGERNKISFRKIIINRNQIPVLGIIIGLALNYSSLNRPVIFDGAFDFIVHLNAWISLLPVGFSMDFKEMRKYMNTMWEMLGLKYIATPIITYSIARLVISNPIVLYSVLLLTVAPTAINAVTTAKLTKLNIHVATVAFLVTTTVYIFAVYPMIYMVFKYLLRII